MRVRGILWLLVLILGTACHSPSTPDNPPPDNPPPGNPQPNSTTPCGTSGASSVADRVIWIWMENHDYASVIGASDAPYENALASKCALLTNYHSISSPSLPNYIAATSGSTQGIGDNNPPSAHPLDAVNLFSQVKASGRQWRSYQENAPANCSSATTALYAVKHDPAPYYTNLAGDCGNWDVPMGTTSGGTFLSDLNAGALPTFTFITPNLCNDTHDCSVNTGDQWLASWVPKILDGPNYRAGHTVLFLIWDEGSATDRIPAIVVSPFTKAGLSTGTRFDHYSLLKTTEQLLGLNTNLGNAANAASMIPEIFSSSAITIQRAPSGAGSALRDTGRAR
jgi:phospholipase C